MEERSNAGNMKMFLMTFIVFSGFSIFALSLIKNTPQKIITLSESVTFLFAV